jgi:hypothetical protein
MVVFVQLLLGFLDGGHCFRLLLGFWMVVFVQLLLGFWMEWTPFLRQPVNP